MKIGFIVECVIDGPESKVLPRLASLVNSKIECEIAHLGSKARVLNECGRYAKGLLENGNCNRVLVVWDSRPAWEDGDIDLEPEEELGKAAESLNLSGLKGDPRISLICIIEELEAWLLADGRGIASRIGQLLGSKLRSGISDHKNVERLVWPKNYLEKLFRNHRVRSYNDWKDAGSIADGIPTTKRLIKHSTVFTQFVSALA